MGLVNLVGIWQIEEEEGHSTMRTQQVLRKDKARETDGPESKRCLRIVSL